MIYLVCHVIFFFLYTLWSVDHNLPSSQYSAKIVSFFLTILSMNGRSYFTLPTKGWYFPPKVEAFLCTLWTVDHTWQTVDLDLPVHAFLSKNIFFIPPLWCRNGRSLFTLPTKGGPFSPKSWIIFQMFPKHMCDWPTGISYFCSQVFTSLFSQKGCKL